MTTLPLDILFAMMVAYLFGSISSAIVVCKVMRLPDPRHKGSGNPGATNVLRFGGKKAAIFTLVGDVLKGVVCVAAAKLYGFTELGVSAVMLAVFLGHLYPVFFQFKGGKGVATALGCLLALAWPVGLALLVTWLVMAMLFRYSSLAALTAALLAPAYAWYFTDATYTVTVGLMSLILIWRHYPNIKNLLAGKESKIGAKK